MRDSHKQPGWLSLLATHAQELAECGVTAVWLPPPCHSIAEQGYMPQVLSAVPCETCTSLSKRAAPDAADTNMHSMRLVARRLT